MSKFIDTSPTQTPDKYGLPQSAQRPDSAATRDPKAILDQYGNPYTKPDDHEIAPATLGGWRYYKAITIADELTPARLVALLHEVEQNGDLRFQMELFEAMEERDAKLLGLFGQRKSAILGCQFVMEPGDDSAAADKALDFCSALLPDPRNNRRLGKLSGWSDTLAELLDAVSKGFACVEILWETSEKQWMPRELKFRPQRWWREDLIDRQKLLLLDVSAPLGMPVNPYNFIMHRHHAMVGAIRRGGISLACARPWLVRNYSLRDWLQLAEICGIPVRLGELAPGATRDDADQMWQALTTLGNASAGMVPAGSKITFADNTRMANDGQLFDKLRERAGGEMELAILGQMETSGAGAGGSGSRGLGRTGKPQEAVRFEIQSSDAQALDETINRQFFRPITLLNFGPDVPAPIYRTVCEEAKDLNELSQVVTRLVSVGQPVGVAWSSKTFAIPLPDEGEQLLTPPVKGSPGETASGIENSVPSGQLAVTNSTAGRTVKKKSVTPPPGQPVRSRDYVR